MSTLAIICIAIICLFCLLCAGLLLILCKAAANGQQ